MKCCYYLSLFHDGKLFVKAGDATFALQQGADQSRTLILKVTNKGLRHPAWRGVQSKPSNLPPDILREGENLLAAAAERWSPTAAFPPRAPLRGRDGAPPNVYPAPDTDRTTDGELASSTSTQQLRSEAGGHHKPLWWRGSRRRRPSETLRGRGDGWGGIMAALGTRGGAAGRLTAAAGSSPPGEGWRREQAAAAWGEAGRAEECLAGRAGRGRMLEPGDSWSRLDPASRSPAEAATAAAGGIGSHPPPWWVLPRGGDQPTDPHRLTDGTGGAAAIFLALRRGGPGKGRRGGGSPAGPRRSMRFLRTFSLFFLSPGGWPRAGEAGGGGGGSRPLAADRSPGRRRRPVALRWPWPRPFLPGCGTRGTAELINLCLFSPSCSFMRRVPGGRVGRVPLLLFFPSFCRYGERTLSVRVTDLNVSVRFGYQRG